MANPVNHAISSVKRYGSKGDTHKTFLHIHEWFDETKAGLPDARHRSMRHHSQGIILACERFPEIILASGRICPVRRIAEQHVMEDLGETPTAADYLRYIEMQDWMTKSTMSAEDHAVASAKKYGGDYTLYLPVHTWLDETYGWMPDPRHQALRHHSEGIIEGTKLHKAVTTPSGIVSVKDVAEDHVREDLGDVPTMADWLRNMEVRDWMVWNTHKRKIIYRPEESKWVPIQRNVPEELQIRHGG